MEPAANVSRYAQLIQSMIGEAAAAPYPIEFGYDVPMLVKHQQANGAFVLDNQNHHPEMQWFDELVILHAVARYAVTQRDETYKAAVKKAAEYHLREIQPDHATCDPWGLLAFIQYAPSLADQLLHAVQLNYPDGVRGRALLLLQDVLYALRILMAERT